jgi:predicted 3-demethylubiquinone-9 3-methyltransferase (glyoxalase superfamily)
MPVLTPSLWFDDDLAEAVDFYLAVFPNSSVTHTMHYTEAGPGTPGSLLAMWFVLDGQPFMGINGGPEFSFTEAVSFTITCRDQAEVDHYWDRLSDGGQEGPCGWLKDRFGLSWQVTPHRLDELLSDPDPARAAAATAAMHRMSKIVVADLEAAVADL